jgi:hypothetical protein
LWPSSAVGNGDYKKVSEIDPGPAVAGPSKDGPEGFWGQAAGVAAILGAAFVTLPGLYLPLGPAGIDPGWQWAVNQANPTGLVFGRDVVFTYGPLAFLMVPLDIAHHLLTANLFYMAVQALFTAALVLLFLQLKRPASAVVFALLFVIARHQGLTLEAQILIVVGILSLLALLQKHRLPLAVAAALSGVLFLAKLSLGVAASVILGATVAVAVFVFRRPLSFVYGLAPFPLVVGVLAMMYFDGAATFLRWLSLSREIVSGYSVANSILGPASQVAVGAVTVILWISAAAFLRRDRPLLAFNLVFAPAVIIQFRLAFVRQDTHQLQFVPFVLALVALSALFVHRRRDLAVVVAVFLALMVGGSATGLIDPHGRGFFPQDLLSGSGGAKAISRLIHFGETRRKLAEESRRNLAPLELPEGWLELVRTSQDGVGTLPWEIQYCPANDLEWSPTPTIQLYAAYTAELDRWSAEKYRGEKTPGFIINEYVPVGKRHQMIDAPATWREIFIRYRLRAAMLEPTQTALLERRTEVPQTTYEVVHRSSITLGSAGIEVPAADGLLFAEFDLQLNTLGRVQKSLFRIPLIYLVMYHASGDTTYYRLTPGPAVNGVLINRFPKDFMGYRLLWQGRIDDPVVRFMIAGPGLSFFRSPVEITWRELMIAVHPAD